MKAIFRVKILSICAWSMSLLLMVAASSLDKTAAGTAKDSFPDDFYYDFRGHPVPPVLKKFGDSDQKFMKEEPEGLRVTLPKDRKNQLPVGLKTSYSVRGDFEITATIEILKADVPMSGYGVGVGLYLKKPDPSAEAATLARLVRAKDKQVILWDRIVDVPEKKPKAEEGTAPIKDKLVRLRLKRTGSTLIFLYAPGTMGEAFQEIHHCEFGADEIKHVALNCLTGRQACELDVRLIELRIRAGGKSAAAAPPIDLKKEKPKEAKETPKNDENEPPKDPGKAQLPDSPPSPASSPPSWAAWGIALLLGFGFVAVLGTFGLWLLFRRRRDLGDGSAHADDKQMRPQTSSSIVSFFCSCGKNLKARVELAGKKIKCPGCGNGAIVPTFKTGESSDLQS